MSDRVKSTTQGQHCIALIWASIPSLLDVIPPKKGVIVNCLDKFLLRNRIYKLVWGGTKKCQPIILDEIPISKPINPGFDHVEGFARADDCHPAGSGSEYLEPGFRRILNLNVVIPGWMHFS